MDLRAPKKRAERKISLIRNTMKMNMIKNLKCNKL